MLGYTENELIGANFRMITVPEDREISTELHNKLVSGEIDDGYQLEKRYLHKNGHAITCLLSVSCVRDADNELLHIMAEVQDISERYRAVAALKKSEEKLSKAFHATPDAVAISRISDGRITYVNPGFTKLIGYSEDEILRGKVISDLDLWVKPEDRSALVGQLAEKGEVNGFRVEFRTKDRGTFPGVMTASVIELDGEQCMVSMTRDVTDYLESEISRKRSIKLYHQSLMETIGAIGLTVEKRDPYTAGHQLRVAQLSAAIARQLGLSQERIRGIELGATIHDIGKIYIPSEILNKPGKLSEAEFELIKSHPEVGYDIIKGVSFPWPVAQMIHQHHERLDGTGYPGGLKGDRITLEAQIIAVADVVEAITAKRPYRPALGVDIALEELRRDSGVGYNPDVVEVCEQIVSHEDFSLVAA
jgi:PAS domain S-box-containing protein/putative nucleotidyltransferase with HDIG domain